MEFDIEQLKDSLKESGLAEDVTPEGLLQVKLIIESYVDEKTHKLQEQLSEKEKELEFVIECAEQYSTQIKEELIEKGEQYGEFLIEKAESYGEFLTEKAESYGEFLMEKAEAYKDSELEKITEKLNDYSEYVVEQFLAEQKEKMVEHSEYVRMKELHETIKKAFEDNLYPLNENTALDKTEKKLRQMTTQYNSLFEKVTELEKANRKYVKQELIEKYSDGLSSYQKEKLARMAEGYKDISEMEKNVKTLAEMFSKESKKELVIEKQDEYKQYSESVVQEYKTQDTSRIDESTKSTISPVDAYVRYMNELKNK